MQKEVGNVLKNRLASLPFIDVLAGTVQTLTVTDTTGGGPDAESVETTTTKRFPVSDDHNQDPGIFGIETVLMPDSARRSIIYFEDYGISLLPELHGLKRYQCNLRLIAWFNRELLTGKTTYSPVSGPLMAAIIEKLVTLNPVNVAMFSRFMTRVVRIPAQDGALFGRYTYQETTRQYLRPPFEFFALDLENTFCVNPSCLISYI